MSRPLFVHFVNLLGFGFCQIRPSIEVIAIAKKQTATVVLAFVTLSALSCQFNEASGFQHQVEQSQWNKDELHAIAQSLAGECYDDKELDKRRVCEVILNRVSNSNFANTVLEVLRTPGAFNGYWKQSRPVSKNDYFVAEQALRDWYDGGCAPLSEWLFFSKGAKRENVFRSDF